MSTQTTADELKFLEGLRKKSPEAFEKYKESFSLRKNWDKIDKDAIAQYLGL